MGSTLHIGCPERCYPGDTSCLLDELQAEPFWDVHVWSLRVVHYRRDKSIDARDFSSAALKDLGPILLLQPIQKDSRVEIFRHVSDRVPVFVEEAVDVGQLTLVVQKAMVAYEQGDPRIPLDQAVALMLVHKLADNHMWAGNAKGYMWTDDLPNGRGFDQQYAGRLPLVISILKKGGLLTSKTSKSKQKYALNPACKKEIYDLMRTRRFPDGMHRSLAANANLISVRALDHCEAPEAR